MAHTCVCRLPDGLEERIIAGVKSHCESTVNDPPINLRSKICKGVHGSSAFMSWAQESVTADQQIEIVQTKNLMGLA